MMNEVLNELQFSVSFSFFMYDLHTWVLVFAFQTCVFLFIFFLFILHHIIGNTADIFSRSCDIILL